MKLSTTFALVEFLAPNRFIDACERVAFKNPGEAHLRRGVAQLARLEGLTFLWALRDGGWRSTGSRGLIGALGLPMLLAPRQMVDFALSVGYANADDIEVRRWVRTATRVLGLLYVLAALGVIPREREQ